MRANFRTVFLLGAAAAGLTTSCYNVGDLGDTPYKCSATYPDCPDGYLCCGVADGVTPCPTPKNMNWCVRSTGGGGMMMSGALTIPKPGGAYPNAYLTKPGLTPSTCPDKDIEPNNTIAQATSGYDDNLHSGPFSICPSGDIDVYAINLANQYVRITMNFDIKYGDLDLGLFDANGGLQLSDPDFTNSNACVSSPGPFNGTYYAVVVGAPSSVAPGVGPMNVYSQWKVEKSSQPLPCGAAPPDMSDVPPDMAF